MRIETITRQLISLALSLMLIVCFASVGRTQQTDHDIPSTADKNEIVASALGIAFGTPDRMQLALSSENIEFVDSARMSEMGFTLAGTGNALNGLFWDDYVVFKRIASKDGVVYVVLSRISVSRACFSRMVVSTERRTFTFEFHKETGKWIGQLVNPPMVERRDMLLANPRFTNETKKRLDASGGSVFRN